jgi:hypothetical protein
MVLRPPLWQLQTGVGQVSKECKVKSAATNGFTKWKDTLQFFFFPLKWNAYGIMELRNGWSFKKLEWPQKSEENN